MKYLRFISRLVVGMVFVFSGFVKAVDPLGSAYKFGDYFAAFGTGFLEFLSVPLSILLSVFEMVLGITLLMGYVRKLSAWVLLFFMGSFTLITLVLALFNPVSDCGCFGDAVILTNWETFLKNVVLMALTLVFFTGRNRQPETGNPSGEWAMSGLFFVVAGWFALWNLNHLPLLDFRPYDVGTVIRDEMEIPEGAPVDEYETTLIYMNLETGEEQSFTIEDYPRDTSAWSFVTSESRLVRKGYEPPIHDFAITDPFGYNVVDILLDDPGFSLLMISHDLSSADVAILEKAADWYKLEALSGDYSFYAVSSSPSGEVDEMLERTGLPYPFHAADEIMLKTVVRSNPGFVLIGQGTILGKWAGKDFPKLESVDPNASETIRQASAPLGEEGQLLREAGVYEDLSFNVLDFQTLLPSLLLEPRQKVFERRAVVGFILAVLGLMLGAGYVTPFKRE